MERFTAGIPIRDILVEHDNWARFQAANRGRIRPVVCENIRRMLACRTPALGFHVYACPECGEERVVPHSCKSRMCSSCGKVASDRWASAVLNDSLDKDYARGGCESIKKLRVFDFIGRLIRHIPDKHFRMVRHYGIFATGVRGTTLPGVRALLGHEEPTPQAAPTWRERWQARTGIDPLVCPRCGVEMVLIEYCFGPHGEVHLSGVWPREQGGCGLRARA